MNFEVYVFFYFYLIFKFIFIRFFLFKIAKKGFNLPASDDVVSGARWHANIARGTTSRMRRGTETTWQGRGWPTRGAGGAQGADTRQEATLVHGSTRTPVWSATWQRGLAFGGPTG